MRPSGAVRTRSRWATALESDTETRLHTHMYVQAHVTCACACAPDAMPTSYFLHVPRSSSHSIVTPEPRPQRNHLGGWPPRRAALIHPTAATTYSSINMVAQKPVEGLLVASQVRWGRCTGRAPCSCRRRLVRLCASVRGRIHACAHAGLNGLVRVGPLMTPRTDRQPPAHGTKAASTGARGRWLSRAHRARAASRDTSAAS